MISIKYLHGDATLPHNNSRTVSVICHCCNAFGGWGRGFVLALSRRYPKVKVDYQLFCSPYQRSNKLRNDLMGKVCISKIRPDLYVANIIGQYFYSRNQYEFRNTAGVLPEFLPSKKSGFVKYESIRRGFQDIFKKLASENIEFEIHMPKIGCGLAGGNWEVMESIIVEEFCRKDVKVYVYDL